MKNIINKDISVCGDNCTDCGYFNICKGCNNCKGNVFYCNGKTCSIYECVVNKNIKNCGTCKNFPCKTYLGNKDPRMTDEEFENSVKKRTQNMKELNK